MRIPPHILDAAGICAGTELSVVLTEDGLIISRVGDHDPAQAWFWTDEWQAGEVEAAVERREGGGTTYLNDEEFRAALVARMSIVATHRRRGPRTMPLA
jgi:antitoxin component of MazEF toxin-antitoxin module